MAKSDAEMISIIMPTLNEAAIIQPALARLQKLPGEFEIIVVDGGSNDGTVCRIPPGITVLQKDGGRGPQLNAGANVARGEIFLFLHVDSILPPNAIEAIQRACENPKIIGGNFRLAFDGQDVASRFFTRVDQLRRRFGIYYGDSAIFVRREVFHRLGGYRDFPIMEDYDFARRLEKSGTTCCLPYRVLTSNRRYHGRVWRTVLLWFIIQTLFMLKVPPRRLWRWYAASQECMN